MELLILTGLLFLITEFLVFYLGKDSIFPTAPDLIVVLGCGSKVQEPLLNDRLEAAIKAHYDFPETPILLTGDERRKSEISSMHSYIREKLPNANIILDPNSLKTWDSFVFIRNNFLNPKLLIITNEFHMRRSIMFSKLLNLKARSFGQDENFSQNWYFFVRERFSRLLVYRYLIR